MLATHVQQAINTPQSPLERQLINDYLAKKGYRREDIKTLPINLAKELMTESCTFASLRLAEIQARSQFLRKIQYEE